MARHARMPEADSQALDYQIGADDLLEISVFDAPELDRTVRVAADGTIMLPLIGSVTASGLTARELGQKLEVILAQKYLNHPHVSVFVKEIESHPVSVLGAVEKPGVYQISGAKTLVEILSMAQGLADDAGDTVIVMHHGDRFSPDAEGTPDSMPSAVKAAPAASAKTKQPASEVRDTTGEVVKLKELLDSADGRFNVMVDPGDIVKVPRAGIVYVAGEVHRPGGFVLKTNENISVLQALALAEGPTHTANEKHARIIRTDAKTGSRKEIAINLKKILAGKVADPTLQANDILFLPNSSGKTAFYRGAEAAVSITGGLIIYRW